MSATTVPRFESRQVTEDEWLILDNRYGPTDLRCTIACVRLVEESLVDVVWLRDLPLSITYQFVLDVLEDVRGFYANEDQTHLLSA